MNLLTEVSDIQLALLYILGPLIASTFFIFFKNKTKCLDKVDKRTFRQSKGMLNMAAKLDEVTKELHPETFNTSFYDQMERDLTDSEGNL